MKRIAALLLTVLISATGALAQRFQRGYPMYYSVENGDTLFHDSIDPAWCLPKGRKMKERDWRKFYKLVYNFNKVYPYALVGRKMMAQVDSTIDADVRKKSERRRYIDDVEKELFKLFEKDLRKMTISQGAVLIRLVDRECGISGYDIIKTYENGFTAGFWQMVAKMFSQDLKTKYDPAGKDRQLEELIGIWDSGNWNSFYYSIFMEYPERVVIQTETLQSEVEHKRR